MSMIVDILDQRVRKVAEDLKDLLVDRLNLREDAETNIRSAAFVFVVVKTVLDLTDEDVIDCLTDGYDDFGIDAIHIGDVEDGEFTVTIAQAKYNNDLQNAAGDMFPEVEGVLRVLPTVRHLFNWQSNIPANSLLAPKIEEVRSMVRDGLNPQLRVLLCNNGKKWSAAAQTAIDNDAPQLGEFVSWEHVNHDKIFEIQQAQRPVNERITLIGEAVIESFDFCRIMVGRVTVSEIASLFNRHGDRLLERNIRRFLGLQGNRVNQGIAETLNDTDDRPNFYFYNNGITIVCTKFAHSGASQTRDFTVQIDGLQIINGGQTCKTIQDTLSKMGTLPQDIGKASVMVRIYELPDNAENMVRNITYATNSQNPVDLRDLRSNDSKQRSLEAAISQLGFTYHRHRSDDSLRRRTSVSSAKAAEAILAVWRMKPFSAKYHGRDHFDKLYDRIFTDGLTGAQTIIATLIVRITEGKRRRPPADSPACLAYGSFFAAMLMGKYLLEDLGIRQGQLDHRRFSTAKDKLDEKADDYFTRAMTAIDTAVSEHFGGREPSLQELASVFRGGALMGRLLQ